MPKIELAINQDTDTVEFGWVNHVQVLWDYDLVREEDTRISRRPFSSRAESCCFNTARVTHDLLDDKRNKVFEIKCFRCVEIKLCNARTVFNHQLLKYGWPSLFLPEKSLCLGANNGFRRGLVAKLIAFGNAIKNSWLRGLLFPVMKIEQEVSTICHVDHLFLLLKEWQIVTEIKEDLSIDHFKIHFDGANYRLDVAR
eukprot:scaffold91629_cov59-Attheya_sp.AAC.4